MASVQMNKKIWEENPWRDGGQHWSEAWGTAADQWHHTLLPRLHRLLPTRSILEIAPGFGRWSTFLFNSCAEYVGIDLAEKCVAFCRANFGPMALRPRFLVGGGMSLRGIESGSISFVFSFDSLVHCEMDCVAAYVAEIARVLEPGGHAFLHHSNLGEFVAEGGSIPDIKTGGRGSTVTAERVQSAFIANGMLSIAHEKTRWIFPDGPYRDCFSLVSKPREGELRAVTEDVIFYNEVFGEEISHSKWISERYTAKVDL